MTKPIRRAYTAAKDNVRCTATITLKDGSKAQCMRAYCGENHKLCLQHLKMYLNGYFGPIADYLNRGD